MIQLESGLHQFSRDFFGDLKDLVDADKASYRDTLLIACSDHGAAPDNVSFAGHDRFLIVQHIGGSIPSKLECDEGDEKYDGLSIKDIEATFEKYDFRCVIMCGHLGCGVLRNWLKPRVAGDRDFGGFRQRFENSTRRAVDETYSPETVEERNELMVCEHVLYQLENLATHQFIIDRLSENRTNFHGWVVDDATARVLAYNSAASRFERI